MFLFFSCRLPPDQSGFYRAYILAPDEKILKEDELSFAFKAVELPKIINLKNLQGELLENFSYGLIDFSAKVPMNKFRDYKRIEVLYGEDQNGILIPKNYKTLVMFTSYWSFHQIFKQLKSYVGLTIKELLNKRQSGPLRIMYEPQVQVITISEAAEEESKLLVKQELTAAHIPFSNWFIAYRSSKEENLPFIMNLQVWAHEFSHLLFSYFFFGMGKPVSRCDFYTASFVVDAINEGLADFFNFLITGSADILGATIQDRSLSKLRDFRQPEFSYMDFEFSLTGGPSKCKGIASIYCLGTLFAHALLTSQEILQSHFQKMDKKYFSLAIFKSLSSTRKRMENKSLAFKNVLLVTESSKCAISYEKLKMNDILIQFKREFREFVLALIEGMPEDYQKIMIVNFSELFPQHNFSYETSL